MKKYFISIISLVFCFSLFSCSDDEWDVINRNQEQPEFVMPEKAYVMAEQAKSAIAIVNAETNEVVWSWDPLKGNIPLADRKLFENPSEVKPVFNNEYILMTASAGAVALIRIADYKVMCYTKCGDFPNAHSAEILPDGNIVTAESRKGEINIIVPNFENGSCRVVKDRKLGSAHNAVWDKEHKYLYLTGVLKVDGVNTTALFRLQYNGNKNAPKFFNQTRVYTFDKETGGHDLFPVYGEDGKLWVTTALAVHKLDVSDPAKVTCEKVYDRPNIKSISNGPDGIMMLEPTQEWWAEGFIDAEGNSLHKFTGARIYKGRWMLNNTFSYPDDFTFESIQNK